MAGTDRRMGLRLRDPVAGAAALKLLRKYFPEVPLSEMKRRITAGEPVFSCGGGIDGRKTLAKLERDFARAGLQAELYEEWTGPDGGRRTAPLPRENLYNSLRRYAEIARQVDREMGQEADP